MFQLGKWKFKEKTSEIHAYFTYNYPFMKNKLEWFIEIETAIQDNEEMEDADFLPYYLPRLYHNEGFHIDIFSWKELEGMVLNWDSTYNEMGEEAGVLYVFEHEDVTKSKIEFLERHGTKFLIRWSGTANLFYNEEYGRDVPFLFEGEITFTGISADISPSNEDLMEKIKKFINIDEFVLKEENHRKRLIPIE